MSEVVMALGMLLFGAVEIIGQQRVDVSLAKPIYPQIAKMGAVSGDVIVNVRVGTDGSIQQIQFVSGHSMLLAAVRDAISKSVFRCTACSDSEIVMLKYGFRFDKDECGRGIAEPDPPLDMQTIVVRTTRPTLYACENTPSPSSPSRKRSWKCLWLWPCSRQRLISVY